jgi:aminoglycoside phosphotransferase (APT) family kinase protein
VPIPVKRSTQETRDALQRWFDDYATGLNNVRVNADLETPQGAGNANETIVFSINHQDGDVVDTEQLVLRVEATAYSLFLDGDLKQQCDLIQKLAGSVSFPVPKIRWIEERDTYLGAPFCIMNRAPGRVPPDNAGTVGWTAALPPEAQQRLWQNAISTFCSIHTDPGRADIERYLRERTDARTGIDQQLDYWYRYQTWAELDDPRLSTIAKWVGDYLPPDPTTALSWGDARIENMIFDDDLTCTAVLDWEMVSLGGPLLDLAWWLLFDRFLDQNARPPAFGTRSDTLAAWADNTSIPVDDLAWYEVFAAQRLASICSRIERLSAGFGVDLSEFDLVGRCVDLAHQVMN